MSKHNIAPTSPRPSSQSDGSDEAAAILAAFEKATRIVVAMLIGLAKFLQPILFAMLIVAATTLAGIAVFRLGFGWFAPGDMVRPALTASTMVGAILVLAAIVALTDQSYTARGAALVFLIVWIVLLVCVTALSVTLDVQQRGGQIKSIPGELKFAGEIAYTIAPAINLIPLLIVGLIARTAPSDKHQSLFAASGEVLWTATKGVGFTAGFAAEMFFGIAAGITPLYVVPAAFVIGLSFMATLGLYNDSKARRDRFDQRVWLAAGSVFLFYMALVTFEAVNTFTVSGLNGGVIPQEHRESFLFELASTLYFASMPVFLVVFFVSYVLTSRIDDIELERSHDSSVRVVKPSLANRAGYALGALATAMDDVRRGMDERRGFHDAPTMSDKRAIVTTLQSTKRELAASDAEVDARHNNQQPKRRERRTSAQVDAGRWKGSDPK